METSSVGTIIYHCISCGRVVHAESEAEQPQCCGHTMSKACEETISPGEVAGEKAGGHSDTSPSVIIGGKKPR
jgi:hypothetical protein